MINTRYHNRFVDNTDGACYKIRTSYTNALCQIQILAIGSNFLYHHCSHQPMGDKLVNAKYDEYEEA